MKKIKILGISASPREQGSRSEELLRMLLAHAEDYGGETELIRLVDTKIAACAGCYSESPKLCTFPCIHTDDTNPVLMKIMDADALAIATPVHWGGPSSLLSEVLGKMTSLENNHREIWRKSGKEPLLGKPFALIASQVGDGATMALSQVSWALNHMGMYCVPWGMIFEPVMLKRPMVRMGLKIIRVREFEWIDTTIRLAAKNLLEFARRMEGYQFDDYTLSSPLC